MLIRRLAPLAAAIVLVACGTGAPSSTPTDKPPPPSESLAPASLTVLPATVTGLSLPGEPTILLVTVDGPPSALPVTVTATASGATVTVAPSSLDGSAVGEVWVSPDPVIEQRSLDVTIRASGPSGTLVERRTLTVVPGEDTLAAEAGLHLAPFVAALARDHPELGLAGWDMTTPGTWVLVVSHYLYLNPDWEVGLSWHVMIPPNDWARIYLRRRWIDAAPSLAFEITSVAGGSPVREIDPPDAVWR